MPHSDVPVTMAVRFLRQHRVEFTPHFYEYEEHGGTARASVELAVDEHAVVKTLVFQTDTREPLLVLMHGDREVSSRQLARTLDVRAVSPCDTQTAQRLTGYTVGGISPFGTRTRLPVYAEETIFALSRVLINGGKRGFLVEIAPSEIERTLAPTRVTVGIV
ncbi:MAG TPA: YbaK/EbsC family protein [Bacteroidota bacterium]